MPDDFNLDWNGPELVAALTEPFHQANERLGVEFAKEITANEWNWPTDPSPRDIVDTGELRRSYVGERAQEGGNPAHDHSWNVDYAMAVHEGADFKDGHSMPARPWTRDPIKEGKLEKAFEALAKPALGRVQ